MSARRWWWSGLAVVALVVGLAGCGDGDGSRGDGSGTPTTSGTPQAPERPEAPGGPVAPGNRPGGPAARGAPIRIPPVTEKGALMSTMRGMIRDRFIKACQDGTVCVVLVEQARDPDLETCRFARLDKTTGELVERGSTVVIETGTLPCTESSPEESESPATPGESPEPGEGPTSEAPDAPDQPSPPAGGGSEQPR